MRFLLIEDDSDCALLVREMLSARWSDAEIDLASTGEAALKSDLSSYDLVLLDNSLPDMTGIQILEKMASTPHAPVIMVTADDHVTTAIQALKSGADDFVIKSLDLGDMLPRVVEKTINNQRQRQRLAESEKREHEKKVQIETLKRVMMTLAHHLNNAIMPITFSAELCGRSEHNLETAERLVQTCLLETRRISAIIERFEQYVDTEDLQYADYLHLKNAMFEV